MLAPSKALAVVTLAATACGGLSPFTTQTPRQVQSSVASSAESNVQRGSVVPTKRKVRVSALASSSADVTRDMEPTAETQVPTSANVAPPQEQPPAPTAHPLPAEFYDSRAEQLHTAYFCLDRVPNAGATQCYDELMRCAEGREIFGLQTLCEARPVVHCFFAIGDMWVVPFCYRTDAACQRMRKGLNGAFEKTPCAHTVRSKPSSHKSEASP